MLRARRPGGAPGDDPARAGKYLGEAFDAAGLGWATSHVCRKTYLMILDDERTLTAVKDAGGTA